MGHRISQASSAGFTEREREIRKSFLSLSAFFYPRYSPNTCRRDDKGYFQNVCFLLGERGRVSLNSRSQRPRGVAPGGCVSGETTTVISRGGDSYIYFRQYKLFEAGLNGMRRRLTGRAGVALLSCEYLIISRHLETSRRRTLLAFLERDLN